MHTLAPSTHRPATVALVGVVLILIFTACHMNAPDDAPPAGDTAGQVTIGDVLWYADYDAAVEVARAEDKALWVHFGENPG